MKTKRTFGKTDWQINEIGLGCWGLGGMAYGTIDENESKKALAYAYEQGIDFFDTADVYGFGRSEELIAEVLADKKDVIIASKIGIDFYHGGVHRNWAADYLTAALEKSLKRLKKETLDLCQLHNPSLKEIKKGEVFEVMAKLKKEGKIKEYGISVHGPDQAIAAIEQDPHLTSIQCIVNMIDQRCIEKLFPLAQEKQIALIAREPLASGLLTGKMDQTTTFSKDDHRNSWTQEKLELDLKKFEVIQETWKETDLNLAQAAIEFVLSFKEIAVVIPGGKRPSQIQANLKASQRKNLTPKIIKQITNLYKENPLFRQGIYEK